jgi:restriction endonuclease S subunit
MKKIIAKNTWLSESDLRLDASYHLSETNNIKYIFKNSPYPFSTIDKQAKRIFSGNIFKRTFVSDPERGVQYLTGSDMVRSDIISGKYITKVQAQGLQNLILKKGWILVSCSGTLGKTAYTNDLFDGRIATHDLIRIIPNNVDLKEGFLYAYLSSRFGYAFLTQSSYGGVVKHIEPHHIAQIPVPVFPESKQEEINSLIIKSAEFRAEANTLLLKAELLLKEKAGLKNLTSDDYDYFGPQPYNRKTSCYSKNIAEIGSISLNAFNHSHRISKTVQKVRNSCATLKLYDVLDDKKLFSTGSFPRVEVESEKGIRLINQSDIFDTIILGKKISRRNVKVDNLVQYGEVLIAGVGTLGENELFCRAVFGNEDVRGKLVSGEFLRMRTNSLVPSGYLFTWLKSDYGFRFIRSTQSGTKQCRPIQKLLLDIPIPIIDKEDMILIHNLVINAHTFRYEANLKENKAIQLVEKEIESWQKS